MPAGNPAADKLLQAVYMLHDKGMLFGAGFSSMGATCRQAESIKVNSM